MICSIPGSHTSHSQNRAWDEVPQSVWILFKWLVIQQSTIAIQISVNPTYLMGF